MGSLTSVIGFVKRLRFRYLYRVLGNEQSFDHVLLSRVLREGEFFPDPPRRVPAVAKWFHDVEILEVCCQERLISIHNYRHRHRLSDMK